jgi:hypothetical protein
MLSRRPNKKPAPAGRSAARGATHGGGRSWNSPGTRSPQASHHLLRPDEPAHTCRVVMVSLACEVDLLLRGYLAGNTSSEPALMRSYSLMTEAGAIDCECDWLPGYLVGCARCGHGGVASLERGGQHEHVPTPLMANPLVTCYLVFTPPIRESFAQRRGMPWSRNKFGSMQNRSPLAA